MPSIEILDLRLSVNVHAPRIDGMRPLGPRDQLLNWLVIVRAELATLWRGSDEHVLTDGPSRRDAGWNLYHVFEDGISRFPRRVHTINLLV